MNPEVKALWVKALRSGQYAQTQNSLKDEQGYCCLGVLCDLHREANGGEWDITTEPYRYRDRAFVLARGVCAWAGLLDDNGDNPPVRYGDAWEHLNLATINDRGVSFAEIADLIEEQL